MGVFRLQNNTPEVYTAQSRDFQLFCRLYDCVFNGMKFDIDSVRNITNTHLCRTEILQLLQTKLGFFTSEDFDDTTLRYILEAFSKIIQDKGSLESLKEAINLFLKINAVGTQISVEIDENNHSIVVGMETSMKGVVVLQELLKYTMPAGYHVEFYFFNSLGNETNPQKIGSGTHADILFVSDGINSRVRAANETYPTEFTDRVVNALDTINLADRDSVISKLYLGLVNSTSDITSPVEGNIVVVKPKYYAYITSNWVQVNYRGSFKSTDDVTSPQNNDLIDINTVYYLYNGSAWVEKNYLGRDYALENILTPTTDDVVYIHSTEYIYDSNAWAILRYKGLSSNLLKPWATGQQYLPGDHVYYSNKTYEALALNRNSQPSDSNTDWQEITRDLPLTRDIYCLAEHGVYYAFINQQWIKVPFLGQFESEEDLPSPYSAGTYELAAVGDNYFITYAGGWRSSGYRGVYSNTNEIDNVANYASAQIVGNNYYLFNGTGWVDTTAAIYVFVEAVAPEEGDN